MIHVRLNSSGYEYDIHSLIKAFYSEEEVKVRVCAPADEPEGEALARILKIDYLNDHIRIRTDKAGAGAQAGPNAAGFKETGSDQGGVSEFPVDFSDRVETKNRLKRHLYELLSADTGKTLPWGTLTGIRPVKLPMKLLEEGKSREEIFDFMRRTYLTSEEKTGLAMDIAQRERAILGRIDYVNGYSLYIGIPFCPTTCLYCSFTSFPLSAWRERVDACLDALERELLFVADRFAGRSLNAVYIGGGTPTTLEPSQLERLISFIKRRFDLSHCLEFTVEAGRPDSITEEKLAVLREQGVTRISINPQTMNQKTLDLIGRRHTVEQTTESFWLAREMGFDNINMDLIMGLPGETLDDVRNTLSRIRELKPDNLTVHSLALKRAARLNLEREAYREFQMVNTQEHMDLAAARADEMGLLPYYLYRQKSMAGNLENVGYAAPGKAGIYNVLIMEEVQTIIAVGAGSISKRVYPDGLIKRCENVKDVSQYIERIGEMIERKRVLLED